MEAEEQIVEATDQTHTGHVDDQGKFTPLSIEPGDLLEFR